MSGHEVSPFVRRVRSGQKPSDDRFRIIDETHLDDVNGYEFAESVDLTETEVVEALRAAGESHLYVRLAIRAARTAQTRGDSVAG